MKVLHVIMWMGLLGYSVHAQEKTTFQTAGPWKPVTDVRADVVMVYGANDYSQ